MASQIIWPPFIGTGVSGALSGWFPFLFGMIDSPLVARSEKLFEAEIWIKKTLPGWEGSSVTW